MIFDAVIVRTTEGMGILYGTLLGSKLIMQTFFKDDFRIATRDMINC